MKRLISCTTLALITSLAVAFAAPVDKDQVMSREKAAWQTYKDKKADEMRKLLSADYRGIYADGVYTLDKEMEAMRKMDIKSFDLTGFDVASPDADTAVVTYKVVSQMSIDGKDASGTYNAVSVWRMTGASWSVILHSNVPQDKAANAPSK